LRRGEPTLPVTASPMCNPIPPNSTISSPQSCDRSSCSLRSPARFEPNVNRRTRGLRAYFDSIDQNRLVDLICDQISDGRVLQLIRDFLEAGVIADGGWEPTKTGVPQGGVASPLWSNIFLTPFDHAMTAAGYRVTRWADDFVVVCRTHQEAQTVRDLAGSFLRNELGVSLHPEKTQIVHTPIDEIRAAVGKGCPYQTGKRVDDATETALHFSSFATNIALGTMRSAKDGRPLD
jgi:hypothetical protein